MAEWSFPNAGQMESANKMYYQTMTKRDVEQRLEKDDVIIIPVGSTENHGNSGPIGEDTFIVSRIAEMVAEKVGCTVAEPVWYGSHPFHHIGQPCKSRFRMTCSAHTFVLSSQDSGIQDSVK